MNENGIVLHYVKYMSYITSKSHNLDRMDIHKPSKAISESSLGNGKSGDKRSNILLQQNSIETSEIGDSPKRVMLKKVAMHDEEMEAQPCFPSGDVTIVGCGDMKPENEARLNYDIGEGTKTERMAEMAKEKADVSISDSDQDELDDLDGSEITWKWEEAVKNEHGQGIKCVDVIYEIGPDPSRLDGDVAEDGNVIYRSTPVSEMLIEDIKDYSDLSSDVFEDFDISAEVCDQGHHVSLLSTSLEDNEDDYEDEESAGFHTRDFKTAGGDLSDELDDRSRLDDIDYEDFADDDVTDPDLRFWLKRKMQGPSTDTSAQSESIEEELARLHMHRGAISVADKGVQVSEEDFLSYDDKRTLEFNTHMRNWLKEGPSLEVIPHISRHSQTNLSYLSNKLAYPSGDEARKMKATDDETDCESTLREQEPCSSFFHCMATKLDKAEGSGEPSNISADFDKHQPLETIPEHLENLLSSLHEIPPVSSGDGSCNMWMVPAEDENGNCMNVVLDDGEMYDIFIFRPSCMVLSTSTQTSEEEFALLDEVALAEDLQTKVVVN